MDEELAFISGKMFDLDDIPKPKRYLYKYFTDDNQKQFVKYYLTFGSHKYFMEHTGIRFKQRFLYVLEKRLKFLEAMRDKAVLDMDLETLAHLEAGEVEVPYRP